MENKYIHEFSVEEQDGQLNLMKDGKNVFCHKLMPFAQPDRFGAVKLQRFPCNLNCGKANILEDTYNTNQEIFEQSCDGTVNLFHLVQKNKGGDNNTGTSKLVSL